MQWALFSIWFVVAMFIKSKIVSCWASVQCSIWEFSDFWILCFDNKHFEVFLWVELFLAFAQFARICSMLDKRRNSLRDMRLDVTVAVMAAFLGRHLVLKFLCSRKDGKLPHWNLDQICAMISGYFYCSIVFYYFSKYLLSGKYYGRICLFPEMCWRDFGKTSFQQAPQAKFACCQDTDGNFLKSYHSFFW